MNATNKSIINGFDYIIKREDYYNELFQQIILDIKNIRKRDSCESICLSSTDDNPWISFLRKSNNNSDEHLCTELIMLIKNYPLNN